jgi:hypothetical protein
MLAHRHMPRFADQTRTEVYATLIDESVYLCSIRTMFSIALDEAFLNTLERFILNHPKRPQILTAVWINPPKNMEPAQA